MSYADPNTIIGTNIKSLRTHMGLTQDSLAAYLHIPRELISYYETGARAVPTNHLSKLAALFCIDEYDFYEEDPEQKKVNMAFAFRAGQIKDLDLQHIADFKKVVRNYLHMVKLGANG